MRCQFSSDAERGGRLDLGMTLIEMIGVLTIVAILAVLTFSFTVRQMDQIASDREIQTLSSLGGALENSILRTRQIPDATQWASRVALEGGMDIGAVTNNLRRCRRVLWYDPSGWFSTYVPYTQTVETATSITAPPANARMMLVSTIAGNLPITSGMAPSAAEFANLWNCRDGTVPTTGSYWPGWGGRPDDVKIHRVNLAPQFVRLVLGTYLSSTNGQFALDGPTNAPPSAPAPYGNGVSGYYLRGTTLRLYSGWPSNTLQQTHILNRDSSFVFENGVWKSTITGGITVGAGSGLGIVAAFLAAAPNTNAEFYTTAVPNTQQVVIVQAFVTYMSNYNRWMYTNLTTQQKADLRTYLQSTLQPYLIDRVQGLYTKIGGGGTDHYPTNGLPWPIP